MQKLLEYLSFEITGETKIRVERQEQEEQVNYVIMAPQKVMGLLIGKGGKTIRAIRSLAKVRAIIDQEKVRVELQEV